MNSRIHLAQSFSSIDHAGLSSHGIEYGTQIDTGKIVMSAKDWRKAVKAGLIVSISGTNDCEYRADSACVEARIV